MFFSKENKNLFQILIIAILIIALLVFAAFYFASSNEKKLISERKVLCAEMAQNISQLIENDNRSNDLLLVYKSDSLSQQVKDSVDTYFRILFNNELKNFSGLEGGLYIECIDDFIGYAFPTSPPPLPAYGPPPRSHAIIKKQALLSIRENKEIINLHEFDPAVFPLATYPVRISNNPCGVIWIRVHIERELPVAKLKRILNFVTVLSLFGFLVMAMISFILRSGINDIRKELKNSLDNQAYRLKRRGGWFGFIPAMINEMLGMLEKENQDRKELEKMLRHREKMAVLGKTVAGVAHEVRTPLSVVKTRVQMWEKDIKENPSIQEVISPESLKLVIDEINSLSVLVKRLLVFSRPIDKNIKPDNIDQIIKDVISLTNLKPESKTISIEFLEHHNAPPLVEVDGNSLRQVLINIINNSVESICGSGRIIISTKYDTESEFVLIEVTDSGKGIPEEIIDKIFDPFYTSKQTGTGLGLTISQEIITSHNGTITFKTNPEGGVICSIIIPFKHRILSDEK